MKLVSQQDLRVKKRRGSYVVMHDAINFGVAVIECDAAAAKTIRVELIEALRGEDSADQCENAS